MRRLAVLIVSCTFAAAAHADDRFASGSCELTVTGDVAGAAKSPGGAYAVGTDYWMTDEEVQRALAMVNKDPAKLTAALKRDPRIALLILNCGEGDFRVSVMPASGSTYKDVPFKAGKYDFAAGLNQKPGQMTALLQAKGPGWMAEKGTLDITRRDSTRLVGTFAIDAVNKGQKAHFAGKFDLLCPTSTSCKKP
jgi:hypothetical protein